MDYNFIEVLEFLDGFKHMALLFKKVAKDLATSKRAGVVYHEASEI
jgi:hypothetical protein